MKADHASDRGGKDGNGLVIDRRIKTVRTDQATTGVEKEGSKAEVALYNVLEAAGVKTDQEQTACKMDWASFGLV